MQILNAVGLGTHAKHKPSQMSGGQQQRAGLARALVLDPKIIFADEPTGNLDSKTSEEMMELITGLMKKRNQTFIMVTHDPAMAAYADKVINMLDGRVVGTTYNQHGDPPELQSVNESL